jgi:hypothetical protein
VASWPGSPSRGEARTSASSAPRVAEDALERRTRVPLLQANGRAFRPVPAYFSSERTRANVRPHGHAWSFRPLIDFEDTLAEVLRQRYAVPAEDEISPAVWARASIGALRTALVIAARGPRAAAPPPGGAPCDPLRACFAALQRGV